MHGDGAGFGSKGGAFALALLALASATPGDARPKRSMKAAPTSFAIASGFGSFTPAAADPRLAAAFARSGLGAANFTGGAFRFTPSGGARKRAITVAVRARAVTRADAAKTLAVATELAPSAYSLGLSVGWKRFALSGDVAQANGGGLLADGRQAADIGVSFSGKRWMTKLDVAADRASGERPTLNGIDQSWSLGLGGTYALTHNIDVSGGVRYKTQREQFQSLLDDRRDSQAVYLGTTFRF